MSSTFIIYVQICKCKLELFHFCFFYFTSLTRMLHLMFSSVVHDDINISNPFLPQSTFDSYLPQDRCQLYLMQKKFLCNGIKCVSQDIMIFICEHSTLLAKLHSSRASVSVVIFLSRLWTAS